MAASPDTSPSVSPVDYPSAVACLQEMKSRGISMGLEGIERLVAALGNPERRVPCIHIAGTNGKGSVAAMLESIFRSSGWRTGLYTSPHLIKLGERIQVDRIFLTEAEITSYVREMGPIAAGLSGGRVKESGASYFEFMTAMAFLHFARWDCAISCVEVGMGGRLDATNVVMPEVSVITSIALDHCEVLGDTFAAIAAEKAGIIKPGRPVILGRLPAEAEATVRGIATSRGSPVTSVAEVFGDDLAAYPRTNLAGEYQRVNAAVATLVARAMPGRWELSESRVERALLSVDWPGRWQRFSVGGRTIILDSSHNGEGAVALDENLRALVAETGRAPIAVVGVLGMARARPLVAVLCGQVRKLYFVKPAQGRACSFEELAACVPPQSPVTFNASAVDRLFPDANTCLAGSAGDTIVVTGSIYLAGEVLARIVPGRGRCESELQDF
jgi:dihydrofolate synthase/folylpolyglutamate synthase